MFPNKRNMYCTLFLQILSFEVPSDFLSAVSYAHSFAFHLQKPQQHNVELLLSCPTFFLRNPVHKTATDPVNIFVPWKMPWSVKKWFFQIQMHHKQQHVHFPGSRVQMASAPAVPVCHTFRMQLLHRCLYPTVPAENSLNEQRIVKEISFWAIPVSTMVSHKDALPLQSILLLLRFLPAVFFHFFFHPLASWLSCALQLYIQSFLCCFRHLPCICHRQYSPHR